MQRARAHAARALPALALLIALIQLTLVHTHGLSRWRLGGFGMYSDYHPEHLQLWRLQPDSPPALLTEDDHPQVARCVRLPTAACFATLHAQLPAQPAGGPATYELWRPQADPDSSRLMRVLVTRWTAP